jgi:PhnB protein
MAAKKGPARRATARRPAKKAPKRVTAVPKGYTSLTAGLVLKDSRPAIDWYQKVFGAKVKVRMDMPDGRVMHAELKIGDSVLMLGDEAPQMGISSAETLGDSGASVMLYVKDCDAVYARAVAAGAKPLMPLADMFWGDRFGQFVDPFKHRWAVATHQKDLTPKQMRTAAAEAMKQMAAQGAPPA